MIGKKIENLKTIKAWSPLERVKNNFVNGFYWIPDVNIAPPCTKATTPDANQSEGHDTWFVIAAFIIFTTDLIIYNWIETYSLNWSSCYLCTDLNLFYFEYLR